ncbi:MAG TPA: phosphonate ABC transporter ATP-binding protein [Symbiobacteriaceae bacterium]|nr:phosphonate ABC transporter ATP-binding protein [Symbiobacteriaceae bacterium]
MLTVRNLTKTYTPGQPPALQDVSLAIQPGELVALLGPSGAGKSTLIRSINGLVRPDGGDVTVFGTNVTTQTGAGLQAVRRQVAVIFQEFHLIDRLPVLTNVVSGRLGRYPFWRAALGLWSAPDLADARRMLDRVGLGGHEEKLARELSGGQRQRVAIARAMMQEPRILLGDEPVASLDPVTARSILQLISDLTAERGLTTILSLHDVGLAKETCQRAIGVSGGRIIYDGPMSGVTDEVMAAIYGAGNPKAATAEVPRTSTDVALAQGCGRK